MPDTLATDSFYIPVIRAWPIKLLYYLLSTCEVDHRLSCTKRPIGQVVHLFRCRFSPLEKCCTKSSSPQTDSTCFKELVIRPEDPSQCVVRSAIDVITISHTAAADFTWLGLGLVTYMYCLLITLSCARRVHRDSLLLYNVDVTIRCYKQCIS